MRVQSATSFLIVSLVLTARGENWPQWRGPHFNGSSADQNLPVSWDQTNGVAWATALPGYSGSTPIVWDNRVFLTSPNDQKELLLLCIDRGSGQIRWQKVVGTGNREKGLNNMASPSPTTDGKSVFALFATGDLGAFDFDGKELWKRNLADEYGRFAIMWIYGSSPLLYDGKLYIQVLQSNPRPDNYAHAQGDKAGRDSYLLCIDPATGKNLWRQERPSEATSEAQEAYTTPLPLQGPNGKEIVIVGANYVTGHSAGTGEEIWRCGGLNDRKELFWRIVPSAVAGNGMVFACGPKRDPLLAIREGGKGLITESHVAWRFKENPTDCTTPLFYQDRLFVLDGDKQVMTCLDPKTGAKLWQGSLGVREIFRASPTGADGKIYCVSENGTVVVLDAGKEFKVLSTVMMGDKPVRASIAVAQSQLFLRTARTLFCIEAQVSKNP